MAWSAVQIPLIAAFRGRAAWPVTTSWQHALVEVTRLSAMHPATAPNFPEAALSASGPANPLVAVMVIIGLLAAFRVSRWRWLPFSYAVLVGLYVLVRGLDIPLRGTVTGYWYADPQRIAALLPLIGIPLFTIGMTLVSWGFVRGLRSLLELRSASRNGTPAVPQRRALPARVAALTAIVFGLAVAIVPARGAASQQSFAYLAQVYAPDTSTGIGLLDPDEVLLFDKVAGIVKPSETVAGNPWDGSSLIWALGGRQSIFPHTGIVLDADRAIIAQSLRNAATDPRVCPAVRNLRLRYVLDLGHEIWGWDNSAYYPGLEGLQEAGVATLVAHQGDARLYRLTVCPDVG
jgi:hypothetical protein